MNEEALKAELERAKAELARLHKFQPTPEQINALPEKLRRYIHHLETATDPAGDQAALACARENIKALTKLNEELRAELDNVKPRHAEYFDPPPDQTNILNLSAVTLRKAEALIVGCESCSEDAQLPFEKCSRSGHGPGSGRHGLPSQRARKVSPVSW